MCLSSVTRQISVNNFLLTDVFVTINLAQDITLFAAPSFCVCAQCRLASRFVLAFWLECTSFSSNFVKVLLYSSWRGLTKISLLFDLSKNLDKQA
jgi:hypothetical protein